MIAWRICKSRHDPWDATGALRYGGRWNSPGRGVVYAADSFAGSLLEILVHALRPRTLPGPHHALRLDVPDELVERLEPEALPEWHQPGSAAARDYGDRWLAEGRSAALLAPALPSRPVGRLVIINPAHADARRIVRGEPFSVPWDERLF